MGVKACNRKACNQVMCNCLIELGDQGEYYICNSCFEELLVYKATWPKKMNVSDVKDRIKFFMSRTKPGHFNEDLDEEGINREFESMICKS
jgi:hypothetical protein